MTRRPPASCPVSPSANKTVFIRGAIFSESLPLVTAHADVVADATDVADGNGLGEPFESEPLGGHELTYLRRVEPTSLLPAAMSGYESERWAELQAHWAERSEKKAILPPKARAAIGQAGSRARTVAGRASERAGELIPQKAKDAGAAVVDAALLPAAKGAVHLLELAADWSAELTDPEKVLQFHREQGRAADSLQGLRAFDMEDLDALTRRLPLQWGAVGAAEGAALGVLAMVPVAGGALAITADMVVIHVLSTAIATRVTYAYGFDATAETERHMIDRMVRRTFTEQAAKAEAVRKSSLAFRDGLGRQNWSKKLREDHKLMAALEKLMEQVAGKQHIPVKQVTKAIPFVAVAAGAGANAHLLRDTASQATRYAQTRLLAEKHGFGLPAGLATGSLDLGIAADED